VTGDAKQHVAIIGGGLSGLATAVHLHLADPQLGLTVLEAADRCGGVIHTECAEPFLIDHGADMFAIDPPAALQLCERIGVADRLILPKQRGRGAMIICRGRPVPIPDGFVLMRATKFWPMLTTPLLSLRAKLRLLGERWIAPEPEHDQSVADFVRHRMGNEVLERIVGPLVAGIYTADVEKLSMLATMKPIAEMIRRHGSLTKATLVRRRGGEDDTERVSAGARYGRFRSFPGGMIELIQSLQGALPSGTIHTGCRVRQLTQVNTDDGPVRWQVDTQGDVSQLFDHVVVATPPRPAADLLGQLAPQAAETLRSIESASTAIVVLAVKRSDVSREIETFGIVVPPMEQRKVLAISFASQKFAGRAPEDQLLIRVFIGGSLQPELLQHNDDQLVQLAREELADLIGLSGDPVLSRVVRWNDAMPQYHVGHLDRVAQIESAIGAVQGLSLVSNVLHGVGIAPVIQAAGAAAEKILAELSGSGDPETRAACGS
jgi:oxygen-dependent protoporphyrinogen oxidase